MQITDEQIAKYQQIYLETYGVPISKKDALVQGLALLRFMKVLTRPAASSKQDDDT